MTIHRARTALVVAIALVSLAASGCARLSTVPRPRERHAAYVLLETTAGDIVLVIDQRRTPIGAANFLGYVDRGAFDGTVFHRVVPGFVIQGGGYDHELRELEAGPTIVNEWSSAGFKNRRGTVGWARELDPDSATREFFINLADNERLDRPRDVSGNAGYSVFAKVIAGMAVVDEIAAGATHDLPDREMKNVPMTPIVIERATRIDADEARRRRRAD